MAASEKIYYATGRRKTSSARIYLKPGKGQVSINGKKISNDGKIDSKYGKVSFNYEIDTKKIGETVKFEIIRNKNKTLVEEEINGVVSKILEKVKKKKIPRQ